MDYKGRQRRLRESLPSNRLDGLLVTHLPNIRYLCGFTGSAGALLVSDAKSVLFTDGRYRTQARAEVQGGKVVIGKKGPLAACAEWLRANKSRSRMRRRIGIESEHFTVAERSRLAAMVPRDSLLRPAPALIERSRTVKDAAEIEQIRSAVLLGADLFDVILKMTRPGVKESEVAAELEYAARKAGAEGMSFPTIIAGGTRSSLPHGRASEATIPSRGFVVCDFGVILAGYCSDMTRTMHVGRPTSEARRIYEAVRQAQQAAIEAVQPGVTAGEVDQAARKLLKKSNLDRYFTHSTGHGVGLEIHEPPRIATGQEEILHPGMVITIEPGVYIPGKFGVRIEDMVVVTERGCQVLTPTSKRMIVL
ncbi:MAG: peptidase M24 family protein [Acidobacteriales bacterium 13_1_40CM_3_55_5]|nr:MAG: peptidase M24 family protein [Acidobacteriales bacterium 13_1_40CM_3_55_5]